MSLKPYIIPREDGSGVFIRTDNRPEGALDSPVQYAEEMAYVVFDGDKFIEDPEKKAAFENARANAEKKAALETHLESIERKAEDLISNGVEYSGKTFACSCKAQGYLEKLAVRTLEHDEWNTLDESDHAALDSQQIAELEQAVFSRIASIIKIKHESRRLATIDAGNPLLSLEEFKNSDYTAGWTT